MIHVIARYTRWLHTMWPAGTVEKLPLVNEHYSTNVPGLYIVGDLTGIPLLKFSSDSGARAVQRIVANLRSQPRSPDRGELDLVIIGAGVSGMAAALEAKKANLRFEILEAAEAFSTIVNFPKAKPIYTYPTEMKPAGDLQFRAEVHPKEELIEDLRRETTGITPRAARAERIERRGDVLEVVLADGQPSMKARAVIVAIGRSGNFRKLNVPGEERADKVFNRLHDPKEYAEKNVLVVGGGDSALETAIATAECGANVTLSYRKPQFSRPKPDNVEKLNRLIADPMADVQVEEPASERVTTAIGDYMGEYRRAGSIRLLLGSKVKRIGESSASIIDIAGAEQTIPNDVVFTMIGREPPLDFFRRSGVRIAGEWRVWSVVSLVLFLAFCVFLYHWKGAHHEWDINSLFKKEGWFPFQMGRLFSDHLGSPIRDASFRPTNILFTLREAVGEPSFYYTLAYSLAVVIFGIRRIKRRRTPYVKLQTLMLMAIQVLPLFILPQIVLPWMGRNGVFDHGPQKWVADQLFESYQYKAGGWDFNTNTALEAGGNERAWWRAYGLILAWPLFVYNVFTDAPMWGWLAVSFAQTFVLIPVMIYFWGKGAYCGWVCSCGALAETLGDMHRTKMPHGPFWNRLNMIGQALLWIALALLGLRILGWIWPGSIFARAFTAGFKSIPFLNWEWFVDVLWAGIIGVGLYFWFSGRVWCRFACPLAALMHIYARFSRFRILADKKKCISCNVCTSVCHQGIDIMNFANKGLPMEDPQCVRCSACVQMCPTGVLEFGQIDRRSGNTISKDPRWLSASPVLMREIHVNGKKLTV